MADYKTWCKKVINSIWDPPPGLLLFVLIGILIGILFVGVFLSSMGFETECLNSTSPRRADFFSYQEYMGGQWVEIAPFASGEFKYNKAAESRGK